MEKSKTKKLSGTAIFILFSILFFGLNLRAPITSASAILDFIAKDLGISEAYSGIIVTVPLIAFAVSSIFVSNLGIKYGYTKIAFISIILIVIGELIRISFGFKALLFGTTLLGLGISTGNVLIPSIIKLKFPNRLGLATGLYGVFMNFISACSTGISLYMVTQKNVSWRVVISVWLIISILTLVFWFINLFIRKDLMLDGKDKRNIFDRKEIFKSKVAWAIIFYMGSQSFMFYTTVTWLPKILNLKGFDYNFISYILTTFQMSGLPLSLLIPIIAARMKNQKLIAIFVALGYFLGSIGLLVSNSKIQIILCMFIMSVGCTGTYAAAIILMELRSKTSHTVAIISGISQSIGYIIAAVGPILLGYLFSLTNNYIVPISILIVVSFILVLSGIIAGKNEYMD